MSNLKCPFCQQELKDQWLGQYVAHEYFDCPKCKMNGNRKLWQELERTRKALDRAKWWLNEIVESHRCTPISTAEMALKEINSLDDRMIGCTTLDIPESYKKDK